MKDLYIHYEPVSNHVMTRGIDLVSDDFSDAFFPENMILSEEPVDFGRYDSQTNFKILRGKNEVLNYMQTVQDQRLRISNWMDFESVVSMHLLEPSEIAEILYLFHSGKTIRSAFFYKLQNNYVFLTLTNGLNKTYYRHIEHFHVRFSRVMSEIMTNLINSRRGFLIKKLKVSAMPVEISEQLLDHFKAGLKINFSQSYMTDKVYYVPLDIIEDDLSMLTVAQRPQEHVALINYHQETDEWQLDFLKRMDMEG